MALGWAQLTCTPDTEAMEVLRSSWAWRIRQPFTPVLFSVIGDAFIEPESGGIHWLNTGTGELTQVAASWPEFQVLLGTESADEWFMPSLVEKLRSAGKVCGLGRCYTYVTLPIFAEGKYTVENLNPVRAREHFGLTGRIQQEVFSLPEGSKVKLKWVE